MDQTNLTCVIPDGLYDLSNARTATANEAKTLLGRIRSIISFRKETFPILVKQISTFKTATNRSTRSHGDCDYTQYVKASVDDFFTVTFKLFVADDQVSLMCVDSIEYWKTPSAKLVCNMQALVAKIDTAHRNWRIRASDISYYKSFVKTDNYTILETIDEVRMEIEDLLFDYTNIEDLMDDEPTDNA